MKEIQMCTVLGLLVSLSACTDFVMPAANYKLAKPAEALILEGELKPSNEYNIPG